MKRFSSILLVMMLSISILFLGVGCKTATTAAETTAAATAAETTAATTMAAETTAAESKTIVLILPHAESPFYQTLMAAMEATIAKEGLNWIVKASYTAKSTDAEEYNNLIRDTAMAGVDGIVVQPMDISVGAVFCKEAMDKGVWVIHFNSDQKSPIKGAFLSIIGASNHNSAYEVGKVLASMSAPDAKAILAGGSPGYHDNLRRQGYKDAFKEVSSKIELLGEFDTLWTRETAFNAMNDMLQRFPKIDIVGAMSDEIALGVVESLKAANRLKGTAVGGLDASPDALKSIKNNELSASGSIGAVDTAVKCVEYFKAAFEGKADTIPQNEEVPTFVVTLKNVDEYIKMLKDFGLDF